MYLHGVKKVFVGTECPMPKSLFRPLSSTQGVNKKHFSNKNTLNFTWWPKLLWQSLCSRRFSWEKHVWPCEIIKKANIFTSLSITFTLLLYYCSHYLYSKHWWLCYHKSLHGRKSEDSFCAENLLFRIVIQFENFSLLNVPKKWSNEKPMQRSIDKACP